MASTRPPAWARQLLREERLIREELADLRNLLIQQRGPRDGYDTAVLEAIGERVALESFTASALCAAAAADPVFHKILADADLDTPAALGRLLARFEKSGSIIRIGRHGHQGQRWGLVTKRGIASLPRSGFKMFAR
jgi:hypothetical protein